MKTLFKNLFFLCFVQIFLNINARRDCIRRHIPNADTVCVCNATYCDDIPVLNKPVSGFATVYESTKSGDRFVETKLKFSAKPKNKTSETITITIDKNVKYQRLYGFGGAFTDTTGQMLKSVNESLANAILGSYFAVNGIEYSIARVPIAGTDYSVRPYSYDDIDGDLELKHFALQKEDLEWKIPFIKRAQKLSPHNIKLFASPWSPPSWMKANHKFNESGALIGEVGGQYYQTWANYFVKFLNEYKSRGIEFWGLTVENEPVQGMNNKKHPFNCLNISPSAERDFIKMNLGPTLEKAGYGTNKLKLMILDDGAEDIEWYANMTRDDKAAVKYVSGIAYHWYSNHVMKHDFPDKLLKDIHGLYPDWFTMNTEACHLNGLGFGRWDYGERYAFDIIRVVNNWVSGWVEWNMALDMLGGPRWCQKPLGYGGTINIDPAKGEAYKQPSFYALGHISKFISPESSRIGHTIDKSNDGLSVLTVRRPDNQTVLIALNANDNALVLNVNDSGELLSHEIPAHSIQSYIW